MKKPLIIIFFIHFYFLSLLATATSPEIMKLSEIKKGMQGEGKTIFKGTDIETFKFTVLGIIEKFVPDKNLIMVELDSPYLVNSGIISGMSGSPVYINGKIIGAVAYGFPYSKKPIGGVTPIEDIIKTDDYNRPTFTIDISNIKINFDKQNIKLISDLIQRELVKRVNFTPHKALSPIKLIGTYRGIDPSLLSSLAPLFTPSANLKIRDQLTGKEVEIDEKLFKVSPADAASIPLIRGDFEFSSSGTVTYVAGDKIYLFGHPFFNLGTVDFPLHKAEVISVVPSYYSSFKMTATRNMIGSVIQDRFSGIQAERGRAPYMIPMKVFLKNRNRNFTVDLVNHPLLTPILGVIAMGNIFSSEYKEFGFQSLQVKGKIYIENERNVIIDDLFSGSNASQELGDLLLAINFFLMNNRDRSIKIQKIDFEINGSESIRNTRIENVILDKQSFHPGEIINVKIHLKNERGNNVSEGVQVKAPDLTAGSEFYLMAGDKNEMISFDTKNVKSSYFPMKLNTLIKAINNIRKNNRIYIKLITLSDGVFIKGHEYPNLPSSMHNIFGFNTKSKEQSNMKYSTLSEYQMQIPAVVKGYKLFKLKIKERSNVQ